METIEAVREGICSTNARTTFKSIGSDSAGLSTGEAAEYRGHKVHLGYTRQQVQQFVKQRTKQTKEVGER
ncbi:hypothetical protein E2C01_076467 [Portunus trituberculatus]|uniref:Uncharacterized protein n=1 Tax=Portunus trituberculatus TaxID=210409 RepID=A0A5B7I8T4_PORTR|nr:hypothetical protein [Portunus trituberculatus]